MASFYRNMSCPLPIGLLSFFFLAALIVFAFLPFRGVVASSTHAHVLYFVESEFIYGSSEWASVMVLL